jgi:hypothetical protein
MGNCRKIGRKAFETNGKRNTPEMLSRNSGRKRDGKLEFNSSWKNTSEIVDIC